MRRALVLVFLAACSRSNSPASPIGAPVAAAVERVDAAAPLVASAPEACSADPVETIDDGQSQIVTVGQSTGSMALEHVRVLARDSEDVVTWTRRAHFDVGDTWQTPYAITLHPGAPSKPIEFPVEAYACATYGIIAPNTQAEPFAVWGRENYPGYELWTKMPAAGNGKSERDVESKHESVHDFVASRDVAIAVGTAYNCDASCMCGDTWKDSVWIHGLAAGGRFSKRLELAEADAPAIAMNEHGGLALYRTKGILHLVWLGADGKPEGAPIDFAKGDVGAPAVALAGDAAVIVWAARAAKTDPYALQWVKVAHAAALGEPHRLTTADSAFAPAVVADERALTLAWMEGDAGRRGAVHVARTTFSKLEKGAEMPNFVASGDETNARDPELSGTTEEPHLIWQSFAKEHPAGVIKVTHLHCR